MARTVIASFVLHWVDRALLLRSLAEIDRILAPGGLLVVADFLPDVASRVAYHHLPDDDLWTYKQNYPELFMTTALYREEQHVVYAHATGETITPKTRCIASCLRKVETYLG